MYRNLFAVHFRYGENALVRAKPYAIAAAVAAAQSAAGRARRGAATCCAPSVTRGAMRRAGPAHLALRRPRVTVAHGSTRAALTGPTSTPSPGSSPSTADRCRRRRAPTTSPPGSARAARRPDRPRRGGRPARPGERRRPHRDAVGPVLRLRHRRHPPGGAGRRLAGQRLGPERRAARRHPGHAAVEDVASAWLLDLLGLPPAAARRLRHRRDDGQLHLPRRRPRRGAAPRRLGPGGRRADGRSAGAGAGRRGAARLRRPGAALPRPRPARGGRGRRAGPDPPRRAGGRAGRRRRRAHDRRACRPATSTPAPSTRSPRRSGSPTSTTPGCTSTAPSGCSPPPPSGSGT